MLPFSSKARVLSLVLAPEPGFSPARLTSDIENQAQTPAPLMQLRAHQVVKDRLQV